MKKGDELTTRSVDDSDMPRTSIHRRAGLPGESERGSIARPAVWESGRSSIARQAVGESSGSAGLGLIGGASVGGASVGGASLGGGLFDTPVRGRAAANPDSASPIRNILEWLAVTGGAIFVAVVVRTFILQVFFIPSESMDPTLQVKDKVVVDKLSRHFSNVDKGQLVVFTRPTGVSDTGIKDLVKRVMAVEGDTIEAVEGQVYVNGEPVGEPYLKAPLSTMNLPETTIGAGQLWVMGDNRQNSSDSRTFGSIPESSVVGYTRAVIWPLNHASWLSRQG